MNFDFTDYQWEPQTRRYRDIKTGRFIPQKAIASLIQLRISQVTQELQQIGDRLLNSQITLKDWQQQVAQNLKILHTQQFLLGVGGEAQIQQSDYGAIASELQNQYQYLQGFATDLTKGKVSPAQFKVRLGMYAQAAKVSFYRGEKEAAKRSGFDGAMRVLGDAEHCVDCPKYAALGAVPIDQVIYPTQKCQCKINCKCSLLYVKLSTLVQQSNNKLSTLDNVKNQVSNLNYKQLKELLDDYKLSIQGKKDDLNQRFIAFIANKNQTQLTNISNYIKQVEARVN